MSNISNIKTHVKCMFLKCQGWYQVTKTQKQQGWVAKQDKAMALIYNNIQNYKSVVSPQNICITELFRYKCDCHVTRFSDIPRNFYIFVHICT